jgi:hypothetical protein
LGKSGFADESCGQRRIWGWSVRQRGVRTGSGSKISGLVLRQGKKRNYERTFVAEILAGAVFVIATVALPDGFTTMFILVLAGTGAT